MSWYSKAWDNTKKYSNKGYIHAVGHSAGRHWGYSVGGGALGVGLGAGAYGYYSDGWEGAGWGGLAGASLGAAGGAAFKHHANNYARKALGIESLGSVRANFTQDLGSYL